MGVSNVKKRTSRTIHAKEQKQSKRLLLCLVKVPYGEGRSTRVSSRELIVHPSSSKLSIRKRSNCKTHPSPICKHNFHKINMWCKIQIRAKAANDTKIVRESQTKFQLIAQSTRSQRSMMSKWHSWATGTGCRRQLVTHRDRVQIHSRPISKTKDNKAIHSQLSNKTWIDLKSSNNSHSTRIKVQSKSPAKSDQFNSKQSSRSKTWHQPKLSRLSNSMHF